MDLLTLKNVFLFNPKMKKKKIFLFNIEKTFKIHCFIYGITFFFFLELIKNRDHLLQFNAN